MEAEVTDLKKHLLKTENWLKSERAENEKLRQQIKQVTKEKDEANEKHHATSKLLRMSLINVSSEIDEKYSWIIPNSN
jgi:small-conductance mechanosensitive channel